MHKFSRIAVRYAVILYAISAMYFSYLFYSLWQFLGLNYFPQNASSIFSIQNSNFHTTHLLFTALSTCVIVVLMLFYSKLRTYFLYVGDELSKVSWPNIKAAQKSTALVIMIVLIMGFMLFFVDSIFLKMIDLLMNTAA